MRIIKKKAIEENDNRVLLVRKGQDLSGLIPEVKQRTYVKERLDREKDVAHLNQLDHHVIVSGLDSLDTPKNNRLESARKAGFRLHTILNDHDVETVTVVNGGVEPEECVGVLKMRREILWRAWK